MRAHMRIFLLLALAALITASSALAADAVIDRNVLDLNDAAVTELLEPAAVRPYQQGFVEEDGVYVCDAGTKGDEFFGVLNSYQLDQKVAAPVVAACWSRAEDVGGSTNPDYSIYIDVTYVDGTHLWGVSYSFPVGDADWNRGKVTVYPDKPIESLVCYCLFRNHSGKAYFKDFELRQYKFTNQITFFDGVPIELNKLDQKKNRRIYLRDVAQNGDFYLIDNIAQTEEPIEQLGVSISLNRARSSLSKVGNDAVANRPYKEVLRVKSASEEDRALSLIYSLGFPTKPEDAEWVWFDDPRRFREIEDKEYSSTRTLAEVGAGRGSYYPFGVVAARNDKGEYFSAFGVAIDPEFPAFYRIACNGATKELYIAFDFALTKEKPEAEFHILPLNWVISKDGQNARVTPQRTKNPAQNVSFGSTPFRAAFNAYRQAYPKNFFVRAVKQGNWMAFAPISDLSNYEDFGFQFKEGVDEIAQDDQRNITTFRYTEPMTWWQSVPKTEDAPRTTDYAFGLAKETALQSSKDAADQPAYATAQARALMTTGMRDKDGKPCGMLLDTPWCDGVVWSMNDAPGLVELVKQNKLDNPDNENVKQIAGFATKWTEEIADNLYGKADPKFDELSSREDFLEAQTLPGGDGEYVDSSEGYVTAMIDFNRAHFAGMQTPLVFDSEDKQPGILRGLVAFEYVKKIADDVHARGKLAMANATPHLHFWLTTQLDVLGTESNWNWGGKWNPMSDADLMYRRMLCCGKPFCFLQNTNFDEFPYELTEKYMKRCLAYGMFPSMFSADASTKHYFKNADLYNRDRELFKRYMPIVTEVAEAGWEPETGAQTNDETLYVERFGALKDAFVTSNDLRPTDDVYLTLFNDSQEEKEYEIQLGGALLNHIKKTGAKIVEVLEDKSVEPNNGKLSGKLGAQDVRVFKIAK
jgi:hypothetical protein